MVMSERDTATILRIRRALRKRSGKTWSVLISDHGGEKWIRITAPRVRLNNKFMVPADAIELGELLGLGRPVHSGGEEFPTTGAFRVEYIDRAEGRKPSTTGAQYHP